MLFSIQMKSISSTSSDLFCSLVLLIMANEKRSTPSILEKKDQIKRQYSLLRIMEMSFLQLM
jgi:hypothetical protein